MMGLLKDLIREIATIAEIEHIRTIRHREVESATRLVFTGELAKHAVFKGRQAVSRWTECKTGRHSKRANLHFPVLFFKRALKSSLQLRISMQSAVYLTAIVEFMGTEILSALEHQCRCYLAISRASPRQVMIAIRTDLEISAAFPGIFAFSGIQTWSVFPTRRRAKGPPM